MLYIYLALGFLFFALAWRTGKYDALPSRWYYPAPRRRRPARPRVIIVMSRLM